MKTSKLGTRMSIWILIMLVVVMALFSFVIIWEVTRSTRSDAINNMATIANERQQIVENYEQHLEKTLIEYGKSGEIRDLATNPDGAGVFERAQSYTVSVSEDIDGIDGIYFCNWNTDVLCHTNPGVVGITMRKDDPLEALRNAVLANKGGIYNIGIVLSPATGNQVFSMYYGIFDENDNPLGMVGLGVSTAGLVGMLDSLEIQGVGSATYSMVNVTNDQYIFHPDPEMIAQPVENRTILGITAGLNGSTAPASGYIEYDEGGAHCISTYCYMPTRGWIFLVTAKESELFHLAGQMRVFLIIFCVVALIIMTLATYLMISRMLAPLNVIEDEIIAIQNYDMRETRKLKKYEHRQDEIGKICGAVTLLKSNFRELIKVIQDVSKEINTTASSFSAQFDSITEGTGQTNIAINEMANSATNQANETSDSRTQVASIVRNLGAQEESTRKLISSIENLNRASAGTKDTLEHLVKVFTENDRAVNEVAQQTEQTQESVGQIRAAADMISDMAGQTNLLSLNASIEAARAGEAGKGFAVVADEIRKLAEQSDDSAKKIAVVVSQLTANSEESVRSMSIVTSHNSEQVEQLGVMRDSFGNMMAELECLLGNIEEMNRYISTISESVDALSKNISMVADISEENAASCQETSANMDVLDTSIVSCSEQTKKLVELGRQLGESAGQFHIS